MYEYVAPEPTGNADRDLESIYDALAQICKQLNLDINNPSSHDVSRVLFPVGHVIIQADDTDPNKYFFGKWVKIGQGKCLVGKDDTDTDFNRSGKTGGSKEMQSHTHDVNAHQHTGLYWNGTGISLNSGATDAGYILAWSGPATPPDQNLMKTGSGGGGTTSSTGTGTSGNLQPYLVVNFWKRME